MYTQRKILGHKQLNEDTVLRKLKRNLRQIQKLILQTMNSNKSEKFDYLFKCKRSKFWSQVSRFRKKKPLNSNSINIDAFEEYYSNCFNSKNAVQLDEHKLIEIEVKERIQSLKNQTYDLRVTPEQLRFAIAQLNTGKSFGFDSVTAEMLVKTKSEKFILALSLFYTNIFNCGIIPTNFNVSMVTPKGKEIPRNPANFRPISVSTTFANIFETLLLHNGASKLNEMHTNQFWLPK